MKYVTLIECKLWEGGKKRKLQSFTEGRVCRNTGKEAG